MAAGTIYRADRRASTPTCRRQDAQARPDVRPLRIQSRNSALPLTRGPEGSASRRRRAGVPKIVDGPAVGRCRLRSYAGWMVGRGENDMRSSLRLLPLLALIGALAFKLGGGYAPTSAVAEAADPQLNACGCYRDAVGSCYCGKKAGKCVCPGECEPKGCEEKRAKELDKEIEAEARRAREADKKAQEEQAEKKRKEEAPHRARRRRRRDVPPPPATTVMMTPSRPRRSRRRRPGRPGRTRRPKRPATRQVSETPPASPRKSEAAWLLAWGAMLPPDLSRGFSSRGAALVE